MNWHPSETVCDPTGKRMYLNRAAARRALEALRRRADDTGLSVYICRGCQRYHLGHELKRERDHWRPNRSLIRQELKRVVASSAYYATARSPFSGMSSM